MEAIKKALAILTIFLASVLAASAATLYLSPAGGTYTTDRNFTASVRVTTNPSMNAAEGAINFPTDKLQIIGVSKTGSIFNLWVQEPSYSNSGSLGNVRFEGVVLNPGFAGDGKVLDITFRVKSEGTANVTFAGGSVLANDGQGTNILSGLNGATYTLQKSVSQTPQLVAPSSLPPGPVIKHFVKKPDGELELFNTSEEGVKWSNSSFANLAWVIPSEVNGVATLFDEKPDSNPGTKSSGVFDSKTFNFLEEGRHYFHVRFINNRGAGPILHYPLFIDLTPPKIFGVVFLNGSSGATYSTSNPKPKINFSTTDELSGIDRYEIKINNDQWVNAQTLLSGNNNYSLPKQKPGTHILVVRAFDKAGNFVEAETKIVVEPIASPTITSYPKYLVSPGQKLMIEGTGSAGADIEVKLSPRGEEPLILSAKADDNGEWRLVYEAIIPSRTYAITAKQILSNGAESLETEPVYMRVNSLLWRFFQWFKNIGGSLVLLLIFIALLLVAGYYYWHRFGMWRRRLRREAREAEEVLRRGTSRIRKELEKGEPREKISRDLESVKRDVEKEIKDIEKG